MQSTITGAVESQNEVRRVWVGQAQGRIFGTEISPGDCENPYV